MSAPQTNIDRQKRRHRGPIIGISIGILFIVILVLGSGWLGGNDEASLPATSETTLPATGAGTSGSETQTAPAN